MNDSIAVLLTCHNRKNKTVACLKSLFDAMQTNNLRRVEVFLVDDGSTDGTSDAIREHFPDVNVIHGNGDLYWNQGMRLAWEMAIKQDNFDFYLWLNDDVLLEDLVLNEIFECYEEILNTYNQYALITGACRNSNFENVFSYGGRTDSENVIPNGELQKCKYINGNVVLIPKIIFDKLGNLSPDYTHAMGDFDYGLRSIEAGFQNYTTKNYIGVCPINDQPQWSNPEVPIRKRLKLFTSPNGLNFKEYIVFRKKFWGSRWIIFAIKAYIRVLFPALYNSIRR